MISSPRDRAPCCASTLASPPSPPHHISWLLATKPGSLSISLCLSPPLLTYEIDRRRSLFFRNIHFTPGVVRLIFSSGSSLMFSSISVGLFSVSLDDGEVEWGSKGLSSLFARRKNALSPGFYGMLKEMARFNREAPRLLELDDEDPRKVRLQQQAPIDLSYSSTRSQQQQQQQAAGAATAARVAEKSLLYHAAARVKPRLDVCGIVMLPSPLFFASFLRPLRVHEWSDRLSAELNRPAWGLRL